MDIKNLRTFLSVAETGSLSASAKELHLTQPAISNQIKLLEEELGQQLFFRGKRETTLTNSGTYLRQKAEIIVSLADETIDYYKRAAEIVRGTITLAISETNSVKIVTRAINAFHHDYPDVDFNFLTADQVSMLRFLRSQEADFGMCIGQIDRSLYHSIKVPYSVNWGVLMNKERFIKKYSLITPENIYDLPLLIARQLDTWDSFGYWLGPNVKQMNIVGYYNLAYSACLMVKENLCCALVPEGLISNINDPNVIFCPLQPPIISDVYIIWNKNLKQTAACQIFSKYLDKIMKEEWLKASVFTPDFQIVNN